MRGKSQGIPTIDYKSIHGSGSLQGLEELRSACRQWGFFKLTGHGISMEERENLLGEMEKFFSLPTHVKEEVLRSDVNPWGFYNKELTKNVKDWKEVFDVGPAEEGTSMQPQWPDHRKEFKTTVESFYTKCRTVSHGLVRAISASLGDTVDALDSSFEKHTSYLRLNYYPKCDDPADPSSPTVPEKGSLGISHHTDAGAVTVLLQDGQPGLQVLRRNGQKETWHDVEARRGDLIINIGDVVQVWSNDLYQAPLHRVLVNRDCVRYSAPFFYNPSYDSYYSPLPSTTQGGGSRGPAYKPIHWGTFRAGRAAGDYADVGVEVQIEHFRL